MGKEIKIFKEKQDGKTDKQCQQQPAFLLSLSVTLLHADGTDVGHQRGSHDPHHHLRIPVHIEEIAGRQKDGPAPACFACVIQKKYNR